MGNGAQRRVMKTNIGNVALEISFGSLKPNKAEQAMRKLAGALVFHDGASKAFAKATGVKREDGYSAAKAEHIEDSVKAVLDAFFENVVITTAEYVKPASALDAERAKLHASLKATGVDASILKETFPEFYADKPATDSVAESETESV